MAKLIRAAGLTFPAPEVVVSLRSPRNAE